MSIANGGHGLRRLAECGAGTVATYCATALSSVDNCVVSKGCNFAVAPGLLLVYKRFDQDTGAMGTPWSVWRNDSAFHRCLIMC